MAYTEHEHLRRVLRREIAGTIGVLTDEHDFRAMRHYRSFVFDDHITYLKQLEDLLKARAAQGSHTTLTLFDPGAYAAYCAESGLNPDIAASRSRFTAELATTGPAIPYDGRPLAELVPDLVDRSIRRTTWEHASILLTRLGPCAGCGEDIGHEAFRYASELLVRVLNTARPGHRHLVCSVSGTPETLISVLHADTDPAGTTELDETEALEFTTVLALGIAVDNPGGLVMRITTPGATDLVYGWRLRDGGLEPLTAGEVFDAYCTDGDSGDLIAPESGVDYCVPPGLWTDDEPPGHVH
ncbi:hypothetical protein [Streptomyces sp. YIM S03343]